MSLLQQRADAATERVAKLVANSHTAEVLPSTQTSLVQVPEHDTVGLSMRITFLLPHGSSSREFMDTVLQAVPPDNEGLCTANAVNPWTFVPVGNHNMALFSFQTLGQVEALQRVRCLSLQRNKLSKSDCAMDMPKDFCAHSAALVYVVKPFASEEEAERQIGPICSVEAYRRSTVTCQQPRRYLVVMHHTSEQNWFPEQNARDPMSEDVLSRLRSRAVAPMNCTSVLEHDPKSHEALVTQIMDDLTSEFLAETNTYDIMKYEESTALDGSTTEDGSFESSVATSVQATPGSSSSTLAH